MITKFAARTAFGLIATVVGKNIQKGSSFSYVQRKLSTTRTFKSALSALGFVEPEKKEDNRDESLAHWEEMYQKGEEARQKQIVAVSGGDDTISIEDLSPTINAPVRVVTFDLDNTLWKTSPTISAANDALADYLSTKKNDDGNELQIPERIEKVMGDLFRADRRKYCPLVGAEIPVKTNGDSADGEGENMDELLEQILKSPVLLTQLRIDALRHVLETENDFTAERALSFAEDAFDVWTQARHDAVLDHLAPRVVDTLNDIRTSIENNSSGAPVLMGAVTDGNSDPRKIEILAPYFDFCVNAESVGVSKPDKRVYLQAIRRAITVRPDLFSDVLPLEEIAGGEENMDVPFDDETLENIVGPYWCHIGDDFLKDIVAAKDMKMRTIFAIGLVKDKLLANVTKKGDSEMGMGEFLKQVASQTVVTLGIGADDYLANALHGEFVDEVAQDFSDIGKILIRWHKEADKPAISTGTAAEGEKERTTSPSMTTNSQDQEQSVLEVIEPSVTGDIDGLPVTPFANKNEQGEVNFLLPRAFRIIREDCSVDIPAPLRKREERTMKEVMGMAQREKSSGVFAFDPDDVASLQDGKKVLMVNVGDTDLEFSRDIFSNMSVEEVLGLTDKNPLELLLYMTEASDQPSFDLF
jgi:FMN phosphatase YigB (HAD superfamily)